MQWSGMQEHSNSWKHEQTAAEQHANEHGISTTILLPHDYTGTLLNAHYGTEDF